jgi:HK97 family phage portal protein
MSLPNPLRAAHRWLEKRYGMQSEDPRFFRMFGGQPSTAGVTVSERSVLTLPSVFACVRNIAEDVAKLPFNPYRSLEPRGKSKLTTHPLYRLLQVSPNPEMTAFDFRQAVTASAVLWGKGIAEIEWSRAGSPLAFWPIEPWRVQVKRRTGGTLYYLIDGQTTLEAIDVLHIKGFGFNGVLGEMVSCVGGESLGLTLAAQTFAASFFGNGAKPGTTLKHPKNLSEKAAKNLKESIDSAHRGPGQAHGTIIIEEGMDVVKTTWNPEEAQALESRQFQVEEVARWFRMPPHKMHHLLRATGWSTLEATNADYIIDTLMPWFVRWEQEIKVKAIAAPEVFVEHLVAGLLRGDTTARFDAYAKAIQAGWMSRNDARELENMNPVDGLDEYLVPSNMIAASALERQPLSERTPTTPETDDGIAFKRDMLKLFAANQGQKNVIFNNADVAGLMKETGITTRPPAPAEGVPLLPIVADPGPLVSGALIYDPKNVLVGGDVEELPDPIDMTAPATPPADTTEEPQ